MTVAYTKKVNYWRFDDHPNKDSVLEKNRNYDVEGFDWWEYVYEEWQEDCAAQGFVPDLDQTHFNGFWSQGDGAAFYALDDYDLKKLTEGFIFPSEIAKEAIHRYAAIKIHRVGFHYRYCHENTFEAEVVIDTNEVEEYCKDMTCGPDEADKTAWEREMNNIENALLHLSVAIDEQFTDAARDLYRRLRDEYDARTSDEYLAERFSFMPDLVFDYDGNAEHMLDLAS